MRGLHVLLLLRVHAVRVHATFATETYCDLILANVRKSKCLPITSLSHVHTYAVHKVALCECLVEKCSLVPTSVDFPPSRRELAGWLLAAADTCNWKKEKLRRRWRRRRRRRRSLLASKHAWRRERSLVDTKKRRKEGRKEEEKPVSRAFLTVVGRTPLLRGSVYRWV